MNEKVDIPVGFLAEIETKIQKIVQHGDCTRDGAIERLIAMFLERANQAGKKIEPSGFTLTVKRILGDASLAENTAPYFRDAGQ